MGNIGNYETYSLEELEGDQQEMSKGSSEFMRLKQGRNVVRVIPKRPGSKMFQIVHQHYVDVQGMDGPAVIVCRRHSAPPEAEPEEKECPVCDKVNELRRSGNPVDKKLADRIKARKRIYCNVIDRGEPEAGPKVLSFGVTVKEQIDAIFRDPESGGNFSDPLKGFDLVIERKGSGPLDTEYTVRGSRNVTKLGSRDQIAAWVEAQAELSTYAELKTLEEMRDALAGLEVAEDVGSRRRGRDRQLPPPRGSSARPSRPAKTRTVEDDVAEGVDAEGELEDEEL